MSKAQGEKPEVGEDKLTGLVEKPERTEKSEKAEGSASAEEPKRPTSGGGDLTIYLFGRTGREKEEWFRRFLLASRMKSEMRGGGLSSICKSGEFLNKRSTVTPSHTQSMSVSACTCTLYSHTHTHVYMSFFTGRIPFS